MEKLYYKNSFFYVEIPYYLEKCETRNLFFPDSHYVKPENVKSEM